MKLKLDDKGQAVLQDGMPVYVHDDGKEVPFDAPGAVTKIKELSEERDGFRLQVEERDRALEPFKGFDPEKAKAALATVANLDQKKLVDAGEVQRLKDEIAAGYERQITELKSTHEVETTKLKTELDNVVIGNAFASSKFIADKSLLPPDIARNTFGQNFVRRNGKLVGLQDGKEIFSRAKPGELAEPDEVLELLFNAHPWRDRILKGSGASGGGAVVGAPAGSNVYILTEQDARDPGKYRAAKEAADKAGQQLQIA